MGKGASPGGLPQQQSHVFPPQLPPTQCHSPPLPLRSHSVTVEENAQGWVGGSGGGKGEGYGGGTETYRIQQRLYMKQHNFRLSTPITSFQSHSSLDQFILVSFPEGTCSPHSMNCSEYEGSGGRTRLSTRDLLHTYYNLEKHLYMYSFACLHKQSGTCSSLHGAEV